MKRKNIQQAIITSTDHCITVLADNGPKSSKKKQKNLRSKLPRRKRARISPLLFDFANSKQPAPVTSFNSTCDNVSCNTTLEPVVETVENNVILKAIDKVTVDLSISETSCVESCSIIAESNQKGRTDDFPTENSDGNLTGFFGSDLTCKEDFSYDDYEVSSNYEFPSEMFSGEFDDFEFTDEYTPSIWLNSGSQFSEKSFGDDSSPSLCFSLFKDFQKQFLELDSPHFSDFNAFSQLNDAYSDELAYWRFEEGDEESYQRLRSRERNQREKAKDYVEEYDFATELGGFIVEQRLLMVNWIIDMSRKKELQSETMFLGVRLLDRFLCHGFFKTRKNLQLLGIACLTLATRIEENQPHNSVRQKTFYVGSNLYSRTEVVAMEWVVQEVLKFQCFSPTIHNFLWFYLKAATADEEMQRKAEYLAALALLDHKLLQFWPSTVAAGLVILVSLSKDQQESCLRVVQAHVRSKIDDLPECVKSLEWMVQYTL